MIGHHLSKFSGHRFCGKENMYSICYVLLQDYLKNIYDGNISYWIEISFD